MGFLKQLEIINVHLQPVSKMSMANSVLKCPAVTRAILMEEVVLARRLIGTSHRPTEQMNRQFFEAPLKQSAVIPHISRLL